MALAVAVRVGVVLLAWTVVTVVGGTGAGLQLLTFAALAVIATAWAALDGRRGTPLNQVLVRWAIVAGALGVYVAVFSWVPEPGVEMNALAGDLIVVSPLIAGITFAPAAIAAATGSLAATNRRARRR